MAVTIRFGALLGKKMEKENRVITESEVAEAIGVTRQAVNKWANGHIVRFEMDMIERFCRYFECEIGDLLVLDPPIKPVPLASSEEMG